LIRPNIIILAAGRGKRLGNYTENLPKGMVELQGKPILRWQLQNIKKIDNANIIIVRGYKKEKLEELNEIFIENDDYENTNMVTSLWCAKDFFGDSFVMAYSDIVYNSDILKKLLKSKKNISVVVDRKWEAYWKNRRSNILEDTESLSLNKNGSISSIGQKVLDTKDIIGQYIGLVYFQKHGVELVKNIIQKEINANQNDESYICEGKMLNELYVTDLLQGLINDGIDIYPLWIDGGWIEIDTKQDLMLAHKITVSKESYLSIQR